jgi:hypothetical protein
MSDYRPIQVPARIADLAFSCVLHKDFREIELPPEEPNFDEPSACLPLLAAMASYGVVVFSVAARPAYADGSLTDWLGFVCKSQGLTVEAMGPGLIGGVPGIVAETTQVQENVSLRMRAGILEDGGRMILLSALAPEAVWPSLKEPLLTMFDSFRLDRPRGRTAPLTPGEAR